MGLNLAHTQHLVPGTDIVFTYGPLSRLLYPFPGWAGKTEVLWFWLALWLLEAALLTRLTISLGFTSKSVHMLLAIAGLTVFGYSSPPGCLGNIVVFAALIVFLADSRYSFGDFILFGLVAGISGIAKQNTAVEALLLFYICLVYWATRRRISNKPAPYQIVILALFPVAVFFASYAIVSPDIRAIFPYVRNSMEVVGGFSSGMSEAGPMWQFLLAIGTLGALFIGVPLLAEDPRALLRAVIPAAAVAFLLFKSAMVRQDLHAVWFQAEVIAASLFFLIAARSRWDRNLILAFQVCSLASAVVVEKELFPIQIPLAEQRLELAAARSSLTEFINWDTWWHSVEQFNRQGLQTDVLPRAYRSTIGNGRVEAVSYSVDAIVANGWRWQPRPVFQTYAAYTPRLDLLNAAQVDSDRAADFSLLFSSPVDGKHFFFEDPASWRETLNWYDFGLVEPERALMKRRKSARYGALAPLGSTTKKWNELIRLPETDDILVMDADIGSSLLGSVRRFLYRGTPVFVHVYYRSGLNRIYRANPENLRNGAIVNSLPESIATLPSLTRRGSALGDRVLSIRFETSRTGDFHSTIPIRWRRLPLRIDDEARIESADQSRLSSLIPLWRSGQKPPSVTGATSTASASALTVRPTTIDPQLLFSLGSTLSHYKTIVITARFGRSDFIDVFFGNQVNGREVRGEVPQPDTWYDVFFNVDMNPFWADEAGTVLRFDPASELGIGSSIEIAGIRASELPFAVGSMPVEFHRVNGLVALPNSIRDVQPQRLHGTKR